MTRKRPFHELETTDGKKNVYMVAKYMAKSIQDIVGINCVKESNEKVVKQSEQVSHNDTDDTHTHTHSILMAILPGEPGLAGCPFNFPSPFIPKLQILLGQV